MLILCQFRVITQLLLDILVSSSKGLTKDMDRPGVDLGSRVIEAIELREEKLALEQKL